MTEIGQDPESMLAVLNHEGDSIGTIVRSRDRVDGDMVKLE